MQTEKQLQQAFPPKTFDHAATLDMKRTNQKFLASQKQGFQMPVELALVSTQDLSNCSCKRFCHDFCPCIFRLD